MDYLRGLFTWVSGSYAIFHSFLAKMSVLCHLLFFDEIRRFQKQKVFKSSNCVALQKG